MKLALKKGSVAKEKKKIFLTCPKIHDNEINDITEN